MQIKGSFSTRRGVANPNPYSRGNACANCWHVLCGPLAPSLIDRCVAPRPRPAPPARANPALCAGAACCRRTRATSCRRASRRCCARPPRSPPRPRPRPRPPPRPPPRTAPRALPPRRGETVGTEPRLQAPSTLALKYYMKIVLVSLGALGGSYTNLFESGEPARHAYMNHSLDLDPVPLQGESVAEKRGAPRAVADELTSRFACRGVHRRSGRGRGRGGGRRRAERVPPAPAARHHHDRRRARPGRARRAARPARPTRRAPAARAARVAPRAPRRAAGARARALTAPRAPALYIITSTKPQ